MYGTTPVTSTPRGEIPEPEEGLDQIGLTELAEHRPGSRQDAASEAPWLLGGA